MVERQPVQAVRLRRSVCGAPGIVRRRRGRGFRYVWSNGEPVADPDTLERIGGLAVPPAWRDVWICPWPNGHIQATGVDAAGRRQYRYHDEWRRRRDAEKFVRVLDFARALPVLRRRVAADLAREGLGRARVLAAAVRLLDLGFFRVGGEEYAEEHETYGLATLLKEHACVRGDAVVFDYRAKGSKERVVEVRDPDVAAVVRALKRRRSGGPELLAWREGRRWVDVRSDDVNAYIKEAAGPLFSAKDFRTWAGTVLAAVALARRGPPASDTARKRHVAAAMREVSTSLGNTPAVCRRSYVDPRVVDRYGSGETIAGALAAVRGPAGRHRQAVEEAVIALIEEEEVPLAVAS